MEPRPSGAIRPLRSDPPRARWTAPLAAGILGAGALLLTWQLELRRLPSEVAVHFTVRGAADGWMPPAELVFVFTGVIVTLGIALAMLLRGLEHSDLLRSRYGSWLLGPLAGFSSAVCGFTLPAVGISLLSSAAGLWPGWLPGGPGLYALLSLAPLAAFTAWILARRPAATRGGRSGYIGTDVPGAPLTFLCASCGQKFHRSALYLFAPRIVGSYRIRCPLCGETDWQTLQRAA